MALAETEEALVKVLVDSGLLAADKVEAARKAMAASGDQSIGDLLVKEGSLKPQIKDVIETRIREGHRGPVKKLGKYVLTRKLGEGAMGAVYMALELEGDSPVRYAIKVLKKDITQSDPSLLDRFLREAKSAMSLRHENIVSAKDIGQEGGYHYYVMDYHEGEPLDATLKRDSKVPVARALEIITDAAKGLAYAHNIGFIHRDIKPANIYVTKGGQAKLLDFGLVKKVQNASFQEGLTAPGTLLGSPHYISPEQVRCENNIDKRTDIYSLGATLFHMVCGRPPFSGSTAATVILAHVNQAPPEPHAIAADVPPALSKLILNMLAKNRDTRYQDCEKLLVDLTIVKEGKPPTLSQDVPFPDDPISLDELSTTIRMNQTQLGKTQLTAAPPVKEKPKPKKPWYMFWK